MGSGVLGEWGAEWDPKRILGLELRAAGHSRSCGHFHKHEGTRDPETKAAEHRHHLLGQEREAS